MSDRAGNVPKNKMSTQWAGAKTFLSQAIVTFPKTQEQMKTAPTVTTTNMTTTTINDAEAAPATNTRWEHDLVGDLEIVRPLGCRGYILLSLHLNVISLLTYHYLSCPMTAHRSLLRHSDTTRYL